MINKIKLIMIQIVELVVPKAEYMEYAEAERRQSYYDGCEEE